MDDKTEVNDLNDDNKQIQVFSKVNNQKIAILEQHFRNYVIENKKHNLPKGELLLRIVAALFGSAWGAPWTQAASQAAIIFPEGLTRQIFEKIFAAGIVITVGADGLWVMLEIGKDLGSKSPEEQALIKKNDSTPIKISKVVFPGLFSFFSCISAVYATVKYNTGPEKFLGIITFVGNYGYGFYGYHKLLGTAFEQIHMRKALTQYTGAFIAKENMLKRIDIVLLGNMKFTTNDELVEFIFSTQALEDLGKVKNPGCHSPIAKKILQILPTVLICTSSSLISIMLTKEFLQSSIYNSPTFAYSAAVFSEIPGFVVNAISNYDFFGRFFDLMSCASNDEQSNIIKKMYPAASVLIPIAILALSLTAPSAAGYIIYSTLGAAGFEPHLQWIATASIIAARLIFSNFTLNHLSKALLQTTFEKTHDSSELLNKASRLITFKNIINNTNITFFSQTDNERKLGMIQEKTPLLGAQIEKDNVSNDEPQYSHPPKRIACGIL